MKKIKQLLLPLYLLIYKVYTLYLVPYRYNEDRYRDSFVSKKRKLTQIALQNSKEVIYIFWTGDNEISENRLKGINSLKEKAGVHVILVTPKNLETYILDDYPLHPAYEFLSLVHKSDYLRCYFMLHHGGGYADIKPCISSWKHLFSRLNTSDKWVIGAREKYVGGVPDMEGNIGVDCKRYHNNLVSNSGGYIYKPESAIAKEWMDEIHNRLDNFLPALKQNPGDAFGSGNYPVPWSFINAQVIAPLLLKYHDKVIPVDVALFSTENYR